VSALFSAGANPQDKVLLSVGCHLIGNVHQPLHAYNSSRGNTQTVIAEAVISAFVWLRIAPRYRCIAFGMGCSRRATTLGRY